MEQLFIESFESPVGHIQISATAEAISSILFVEAPSVEQSPSPLTQKAIEELQDFFRGGRTEFTLQLEPQGTAFEKQVWQELTSIPFGATCSYLDIARRLNNLGAIRAVGRANGANPIAIVIPCHRVIGSDGSLTGYGGGLWRKRWLLDHEARVAGSVLF